jgi:O-antigen ligase
MNAVIGYFLWPSRAALEVTNVVFFCVCLCFAPLLGSAVSVYVISGALYCAWHVARSDTPWPTRRPILWSSLAFLAFFLAEALAGLVHPGGKWVAEIVENLPFLGLWPLYGIIHADRERLIGPLVKSAAAASVLGALLTGPVRFSWERAELMAGNPGVLAVLASILLAINLLGFNRSADRTRWWSALGAACSAYIILATGMRALWPALVAVPILARLILVKTAPRKPARFSKYAAGFLVLLFVGAFSFQLVSIRVGEAENDLRAAEHQDYATSIGKRLLMWRAGYLLFLEEPIFGRGPGNSGNLMAAKTKEISGVELSYTHYHNAIITELVRSGIAGLAALAGLFIVPFSFCLRAKKDDAGTAGFYLLCCVQSAYLLSGLTGIMFGHDILDSVYISAVTFSLYMVFGREPAKPGSDAATAA